MSLPAYFQHDNVRIHVTSDFEPPIESSKQSFTWKTFNVHTNLEGFFER